MNSHNTHSISLYPSLSPSSPLSPFNPSPLPTPHPLPINFTRPSQELSPRCVSQLSDSLGPDQLAVFGLGEGRRALTLTANGNAVRSAERHGVALEVVLHRPVWLTGL